VSLSEGDAVLFSSRVIPGNEKSIAVIQNTLADRGIQLITSRQDDIHVSGHPCRDELSRMYGWARPRIAIPVHGERRHVNEHARFALSRQVPFALAPDNGQIVRLAPGDPAFIDEVPVGRLLLDGDVLTPSGAEGLIERKRLAYNGYLSVSVILGKTGVIDVSDVLSRGLSEPDGRAADESLEDIDEAVSDVLGALGKKSDDERIERDLTRAMRKAAMDIFGKRPVIDVIIHRI
jgi:ribonuclease J